MSCTDVTTDSEHPAERHSRHDRGPATRQSGRPGRCTLALDDNAHTAFVYFSCSLGYCVCCSGGLAVSTTVEPELASVSQTGTAIQF